MLILIFLSQTFLDEFSPLTLHLREITQFYRYTLKFSFLEIEIKVFNVERGNAKVWRTKLRLLSAAMSRLKGKTSFATRPATFISARM